jgi:APA family basic amino acid/polyamine antiporter
MSSIPAIGPAATHDGNGLKRTLSTWSLLALGIGNIIGAGIFVLTGQAAAIHAGPAIGLSFVVSAVVCAFAGLCYAEMASSVPVSGSAYTYAYATMGRLMAWIIGWDLILEYALGAAGVAVGWSGYVVSFLNDLGLTVPPALTAAPFAYDPAHGEWHRTATLINFPAMLVTAVTSILLVLGTRESVRINNIIVVLKVAIVVIFIAAAVWFVSSANWVTAGNPEGAFIPANVGPGQFGWSGIMRGAAVVFFAYIGFDAVSTAAQEAKNPQRSMPIGILGSLVICTILYVLVGFVITAGFARQRPFPVLHAPRHDDGHRDDRHHPGRTGADGADRRAGQHRHLARLRDRVRRGVGVARHAARIGPPVQDARGVDRRPRRSRLLRRPDVRSARRHLGAPGRVARGRASDLRPLRHAL